MLNQVFDARILEQHVLTRKHLVLIWQHFSGNMSYNALRMTSTRNYLVYFNSYSFWYNFSSSCLFVMQVFLTKHYRNRRTNDPEFVLDLEEIYVIDSKTKSITRARVLV